MCHLSPTVHLAWAVLTCGLLVFLIQHLWRFDRFKCLTWSGGRQPGTFKRVMTYSYITSVPALALYAVSMAVLKYRNGYTFIPGHGAIPTPYQLWEESDRAWLQPLYIIFGIVWGLEIVTHLEELMFWLFLLHQGPDKRGWFTSLEFRIWALGSCVAMAGLPLTSILTRANPLKAEAYLFLVGSLSSFTITVLFFIVLAEFPKFLRRVKKEGAATPVVLRLVKFHELNILRVIFRLFMAIPLIVLGVDGVRGHTTINEKVFWTDLLAFLAAVGTVVSSTMTLLIFFPRSLAEDSNWCPQSVEAQPHRSSSSTVSRNPDHHLRQKVSLLNIKPNQAYIGRHSETSELFTYNIRKSSKMLDVSMPSRNLKHYNSAEGFPSSPPIASSYPVKPFSEEYNLSQDGFDYQSQRPISGSDDRNSRGFDYYELHEHPESNLTPDSKIRLMELGEVIDRGMRQPRRPPRLHPYITSFTSPIDLPDGLVPRAI